MKIPKKTTETKRDNKQKSLQSSSREKKKEPKGKVRLGVKRIEIEGYKCFPERTSINFGNLTIFAGRNSSGKSSVMQMLLLIKQTLESSYEQTLTLDSSNIKFSRFEELLSIGEKETSRKGTITFMLESDMGGIETRVESKYRKVKGEIVIAETTYQKKDGDTWKSLRIKPGMSSKELHEALQNYEPIILSSFSRLQQREGKSTKSSPELTLEAFSERCFLGFRARLNDVWLRLPAEAIGHLHNKVCRGLLHVPGIRGNPERTYPKVQAHTDFYPGRFDQSAATVLNTWKATKDPSYQLVNEDIQKLGLAGKLELLDSEHEDNKIEVRVSVCNSQSPNAIQTVNISDVGFGVAQVIPILVALRKAQEAQIVYIEQPELHLHPNAQVVLAELIFEATKRGVQVILETHSSLMLLKLQILKINNAKSDKNRVLLHWFTQSEDGLSTRISTHELTEGGNLGTWPQDFDKVTMDLQNEFLESLE